MFRVTVFSCVLAWIITPLAAQTHDQQPYERVLIPIMSAEPTPGAFGSLWQPVLTMRNDSDGVLDVTPFPQGLCVSSCAQFAPHQTFALALGTPNANGGQFLYVGSPGLDNVAFTLRIQDLSRQALTWGTTIPVVRRDDTFTSRLRILDVPVAERFRSAVRIYDFNTVEGANGAVRMRIFEAHGDRPIVDTVLPLIAGAHNDVLPANPAFAMIGSLVDAFPEIRSVVDPTLPPTSNYPPRLRIEIEPLTEGLRFWAFATVTHNETQHVTVIPPAR